MEVYIQWTCKHESLYTVGPLNKGHIEGNINSAVLSFIERLSSFRGSKCTIGHVIFGTSNSVLCREVYYTVSLFRRLHYWPLYREKDTFN